MKRLERTKQCAKCPWKKSTDPYTIPLGYSRERHEHLVTTIAEPGSLLHTGPAMACHEHPVGKEVFCVGWLVNQLGPGNNIALRLQIRHYENAGDIEVVGEQHACFVDTLPPK